MTLLLQVTDNEDGTGGVLSLTGAGLSDVNTVQYVQWTGGVQVYPWTVIGTITGNGTLAVNPGSNLYQWVATGPVGLSPLVYGPLTAGVGQSIHFAIIEAVRARVASLALPGITSTNVLRRWIARVYEKLEGSITPPYILVAPIGGEVYERAGLADVLSQDNIGWPVVVVLVDKPGGDSNYKMNTLMWYRERIQKCLRNQRLPGVPRNIAAYIEPDAIVDVGAFQKGFFVSITVIHFYTRETRGLT